MNEYTDKLITSFYNELEETLLAVVAAGVPISDISYESPEIVWDDYKVSLKSNIRFKNALL